MSLFEFLMILLSIIIGLGLSELLTGFARILRHGRLGELTLPYWALSLTLLLVLLQVFWESWSLNTRESWTFPAVLLMLSAPILLYLVTHLVFPEEESGSLADYYYGKSRLIYGLLILTAVSGVLFRPLAFEQDLLVVDNLSTFPILLVLGLLAWSKKPAVHNVLTPLCGIAVVLDTLAISYSIG